MDSRIYIIRYVFGAGNLIFPPNLGQDSGHFFWPAVIAFCLTGIGLPLLGVIVGALDKQGYVGSLNKISPKFSVIFFNNYIFNNRVLCLQFRVQLRLHLR